MKLARLADLRNALEKRKNNETPLFVKIDFSGLPGFNNTIIELNSHVVAICGGTGLGKTALLDLLFLSLRSRELDERFTPKPRLGSAVVNATLRHHGVDLTYQRSATDRSAHAGFTGDVELVGLSARTSGVQDFFSDQDIEILKQGVSPYKLDKDLCSLASLVCNKNYKEVSVYEIESADDKVIPYFEILDDGGIKYNSACMATGELSTLFLAWIFSYIEPGSVLLLEEPEAYLPPSSHSAIYGMICHGSLTKKIAIALTTHSALIASEAPRRFLVSIRQEAGQSAIARSTEAKSRTLSRLGLIPTHRAAIFVEDSLAEFVLSEIISQHDFVSLSNIEIVNTKNGDGGVKTAIEGIPKNLKSISVFGVLDGDMRTKAAHWECHDNLLFLPFMNSMEVEFIQSILSNTRRFGKIVGREFSIVSDVISSSRGMEPHDQFKYLAKSFGIDDQHLARVCLQLWALVPAQQRRKVSFVRALAKHMGVSLL